MPLVNGKVITPDAAMAQGLCPECGADLKTHNPIAELRSHWKKEPPTSSRGDEARRRRAMLVKFIADNKVRTTNMPDPQAGAAKPGPASNAPLT